jgi:predicted acylesterase/phospholipase RssA
MIRLDNWKAKYAPARPRRLLAFDGGGIRGIIALEIARRIETQLAAMTGEGDAFRLGNYFDYIGGTSTGAIIATGLALGKTVRELIEFYRDGAPLMFQKRWLLRRWRSLYTARLLRERLKKDIGDRTLGATDLKSLLLIVTRNATTDSPWPVSNNPFAKYNEQGRPDCNLNIPLSQLVRASTAAPIFFPPERLEWGKAAGRAFSFIDGGITSYHNPAYLMFRMATQPHYRLSWPVGERNLMLISVGTGSARRPVRKIHKRGRILPSNLRELPSVLIDSTVLDQDINCRTVGRCVFGPDIDQELGNMIPRRGDPLEGDVIPLEEDCGRQFLYARYNPRIDAAGLGDLGLGHLNADDVGALDGVRHIDDMQKVGRAYAEKFVDMSPFARFT